MQNFLILLFLFLSFFFYGVESFIYKIVPEEISPGNIISIYGKWSSDINEISLIFNDIKIENDSLNIVYFSNERIDFLITDFYEKTNFYLNSSGNSISRILNIKPLLPVKYFNKNSYKLKYVVKIDFYKIINIGSGKIYIYSPTNIV